MAKVVKDSRDGRWLARWRDPDGYQRKRSFPRRVEAERFLVALTAEQHRGNYLDPSAGKVTVAAWSSQWAAGLSHLKLTTLERYLGILRVHILPRWVVVRWRRSHTLSLPSGSRTCPPPVRHRAA